MRICKIIELKKVSGAATDFKHVVLISKDDLNSDEITDSETYDVITLDSNVHNQIDYNFTLFETRGLFSKLSTYRWHTWHTAFNKLVKEVEGLAASGFQLVELDLDTFPDFFETRKNHRNLFSEAKTVEKSSKLELTLFEDILGSFEYGMFVCNKNNKFLSAVINAEGGVSISECFRFPSSFGTTSELNPQFPVYCALKAPTEEFLSDFKNSTLVIEQSKEGISILNAHVNFKNRDFVKNKNVAKRYALEIYHPYNLSFAANFITDPSIKNEVLCSLKNSYSDYFLVFQTTAVTDFNTVFVVCPSIFFNS